VELIPPGTKLDFIGRRRRAFLVSAILLALALVAMLKPGIRLGVEFRGGWEMEVRFDGLSPSALCGAAQPAGRRGSRTRRSSSARREGTFLIRGSGADQTSR
jgi:preprotein translocase subunit SecF